MDKSYIAGMYDGDGSIIVGKLVGGYQLKVELTQCNLEFLKSINEEFSGIGKIYMDKRVEKYRNECAGSLRFTGVKAISLLNLMEEYAIIKAPQAKIALEFLELGSVSNPELRAEYHKIMGGMSKDKLSYVKDYSKVNNAYIAGLLDAEGNIYCRNIPGQKIRYYVKITQKSEPGVIAAIKEFLGYGHIYPCEPYRIRFENKKDIKAMWIATEQYLTIKKTAYKNLIEVIK